MTNLTLESQVHQHPDQIAAEADGELLMMHIESGNYFGLNAVASFIWQQLEQPRTINEVCNLVLGEFDVDEARCRADTLTFLQGMIDDGLVQMVGTESDAGTAS